MIETVRQHAGQILTIGFEGADSDARLATLLREVPAGGVIFFQRNIVAPEQFQALVQEVREAMAPGRAILALDLEGGLVDRFRELIAPLPSFRDAARAGLARELGKLAGMELTSFSLNVDFAPVLDLSGSLSAPVLDSRTASENPEQVIQAAREFLAGLSEMQVLGCGKHFPGLGSAPLDSHLTMPTIDKSEEALWREDLLPFRELAPVLPMIMVAHAWYPALENGSEKQAPAQQEPVPASLSATVVTGLLRQRIGYTNAIVCDDLEMGGALGGRSIGEAALAALRAGCDMLLVCRREENVREVFSAVVLEAERDEKFRGRLAQAAQAVSALQNRLPTPTESLHTSIETLRDNVRRLTDEVRSRLARLPV